MTKETMTVHEALSELKRMDNRIYDAIKNGEFIATKTHSSKQIKGKNISDFARDIIASYDKAVSLINRRAAIKKAITLSNAKTTVTINNITYTVAEVIEMKQHGTEFKQLLIREMSEQMKSAMKCLEYNESKEFQTTADNYLVSMFGTKESKIAAAELQKERENFIAMKSVELVDPLNLAEQIKQVTEEVSAFNSKCDSALSVSNALTTIEIEY